MAVEVAPLAPETADALMGVVDRETEAPTLPLPEVFSTDESTKRIANVVGAASYHLDSTQQNALADQLENLSGSDSETVKQILIASGMAEGMDTAALKFLADEVSANGADVVSRLRSNAEANAKKESSKVEKTPQELASEEIKSNEDSIAEWEARPAKTTERKKNPLTGEMEDVPLSDKRIQESAENKRKFIQSLKDRNAALRKEAGFTNENEKENEQSASEGMVTGDAPTVAEIAAPETPLTNENIIPNGAPATDAGAEATGPELQPSTGDIQEAAATPTGATQGEVATGSPRDTGAVGGVEVTGPLNPVGSVVRDATKPSQMSPSEYATEFADDAGAYGNVKNPDQWLRNRQKQEIQDLIREELDTAADFKRQGEVGNAVAVRRGAIAGHYLVEFRNAQRLAVQILYARTAAVVGDPGHAECAAGETFLKCEET